MKKKYKRNPNFVQFKVEILKEEKEKLDEIRKKEGVPLSKLIRPLLRDFTKRY